MSTTKSATYLVLSAGTGLVEVGLPLLSLTLGAGLVQVTIVGLAYQLGAPIARSRLCSVPAVVAASILGAVALIAVLSSFSSELLIAAAFLLAFVLQAGRQSFGRSVVASTFVKRGFRIAGFVLAGVAPIRLMIVLSISLCALASLTVYGSTSAVAWAPDDTPAASRVYMAIHQAHYFVYAYVIVWVLYDQFGGAAAVGSAFAVSWAIYASTPLILRRFDPLRCVVVGHAFAAVMLLGLSMADSSGAVVGLWFFTGLGGGTVFGLRYICELAQDSNDTIDYWEDVGHVFGAILSVVVVVALGSYQAVFIVAALLAIFVSALVAHSIPDLSKVTS